MSEHGEQQAFRVIKNIAHTDGEHKGREGIDCQFTDIHSFENDCLYNNVYDPDKGINQDSI